MRPTFLAAPSPDRCASRSSTSSPRPATAERATSGDTPLTRISSLSISMLSMFALHPLYDLRVGSEVLQAHRPVELVVLPLHGGHDVFHRQPSLALAGALQAGVEDDG